MSERRRLLGLVGGAFAILVGVAATLPHTPRPNPAAPAPLVIATATLRPAVPTATPVILPTATPIPPTIPPTVRAQPTATALPATKAPVKAATKAPARAPTKIATKVPTRAPTATPRPAITSDQRIGAICRDGTRSTATGRGACSRHGGVDHWLYGP